MVLGITSLSLVRGNRFVEMMMVLMAGRDAPKNPLFPPISEFVLDRIFEFVLDRTPCKKHTPCKSKITFLSTSRL